MISELFLKLYLEEHKLRYKLKNEIYTIRLDTVHKKWFNSNELKLTFNPKVKDKKIILVANGSSLINTLLMQHLDMVPISSLKIKEDKEGLIELNERLSEINKFNALYQIDEKRSICVFSYFEVIVNTAKKKEIFKKPLLEIEDKIIDATGIESSTFLDRDSKLDPRKRHIKLLDELSKILKPELDKLWVSHSKDMEELIEIQYAYNDQSFNELEKKETFFYERIKNLESDKVSATTFDRQANLANDIKSLKNRYKKLIEENKVKRLKITKESEVQIEALKNRELNIEVNILAYAEIDMSYYEIKYENNEVYLFIPCLHKFVKLR